MFRQDVVRVIEDTARTGIVYIPTTKQRLIERGLVSYGENRKVDLQQVAQYLPYLQITWTP
jgi:hypothetical protein